MGIQGLLPFLKDVLTPSHIRNYRGCTVAIDTYCWLHKGAFACAEKLAAGEKTDMYVYYCMKYINMLLSYDIKPILVFDGCHLPSKKDVEKKRRERREMNRKKAVQLLRDGRRKEARDALVQCIDITPQMALELMNAAREKGVDCITAPYEADAQLAYLSRTGIAQVIITEDSDLILFGCDTIMFKMDTVGGGMLIKKQDLNKAMKLQNSLYTFDKFRYMCMLSGCDYLPSLPGIGLSKACKAMKLTRQIDPRLILKKLPMFLNMRNLTVTAEYIEGFIKADNTFLYQLVFDPRLRSLVPLTPYPADVDPKEMKYAGPPMTAHKALQLALGNMDIHGNMIADYDPATYKSQNWDNSKTYLLSVWNPDYKPKSECSEEELKDEQRPSTKGKEALLQSMGIAKTDKKRKADNCVRVKLKSPVKKKQPDKHELTAEEIAILCDDDSFGAPSPKKFCKSTTPKKTPQKRRTPQKLSAAFDSNEFNLSTSEPETVISDTHIDSSSSTNHQSVVNIMIAKDEVKKTPSRNIFAASKSPRKKFSLDGQKITTEVRSRFFTAASKPLAKTTFYEAIKPGVESIGDEDEVADHEATSPCVSDTDSSVSKLGLLRRNSVKSHTDTTQSQPESDSQQSLQTSSQRSSLYSMDMECWRPSSSQNLSSQSQDLADCQSISSQESKGDLPEVTCSLSPAAVTLTPVLKSGCRRVGLQKPSSQKKGKAKSPKNTENQGQKSIKSFFESQFAFQKKSDKMSKPLSPKDNVIEIL